MDWEFPVSETIELDRDEEKSKWGGKREQRFAEIVPDPVTPPYRAAYNLPAKFFDPELLTAPASRDKV